MGERSGDDRSRRLLALVDGHSLAYRAFFALPEELATTTGQRTNAVFGFTSMLIKLLAEHRPDQIGVMFDKGRPAERLEILPEYKANRATPPDDFRSQMPLIFEVLDALAIRRVVLPGVEADDLIATYAEQAVQAGMDVLIVTGDRDVFQLVNEHVRVLYTRRGISDTVIMDTAAVTEKYGVEPERYPMLAALRGDSSDNIAGVPGVGDKTAAKLLTQFGNLEGIFDHLDEVAGKKLPVTLAEHRQAVFDGHQVTMLHRDVDVPVPLDELAMGTPDTDAVRRLFATLEFRSLWERLNDQVLGDQVFGSEDEQDAAGFDAAPARLSAGGLRDWLAMASPDAPIAVLALVEERPPHVRWTRVALAAVTTEVAGAAPPTSPVVGVLDDLTAADLDALGEALADPARRIVTHDAKRLDHAATSRGWVVEGLEIDTQLAAYLVAPAQRSYDLEPLARQYLNKSLSVAEADTDDGQLAMAVDNDTDDWAEQCLRAQAVSELAEVLGHELDDRQQRPLLRDLELPLVGVLAHIERTGIAVDLDVLDEIGHTLGDRMYAAREEVYGFAGHEFNLDSPKQLQVVLFEELDLPKTKRIKTGYSTDAHALASLAEVHPIVAPLLEYREVSKLKGTYVDALPPLVDKATGRIHASFNQTVAVTGRLSSADPNLQNIPIRSMTGREIRRAFVPGEGFDELLVADYSQIELRVMAHLSGDEGLLAAFRSEEDIHATTAAMVWDLPISAVDNTLRSRIKGMTYGLAYGLSAYGLGQQLGIPPDEARELMDAYFERFPGVRTYLEGVVNQARRDGFTATILGRRRYLPDLMSDNRQRREMAGRMALNAPIQGTAADIIKLAMVAVARRMRAEGLQSQLLLQVHDELVCEVASGERERLRTVLIEEMAGVADLAVPLDVDTAYGESWFAAEKH